MNGWIGVDLDGTLAHYESYQGDYIGAPIGPMVDRVKRWLAEGMEVRIFTARVFHNPNAVPAIQEWCRVHIGQVLEITCCKDYMMMELWDDRAVQVVRNSGHPTCSSTVGLL